MDWQKWTIDKEIAQAKACLRINAPHLLAPEWVPVAEGLPEEWPENGPDAGFEVLAVDEAGDRWLAMRVCGEWRWSDGSEGFTLCGVTHWMPLPARPNVTDQWAGE